LSIADVVQDVLDVLRLYSSERPRQDDKLERKRFDLISLPEATR